VVLVADIPDEAGNFEVDAEEVARGILASRDPRKTFSSAGWALIRRALRS
jgi:hypothetical protein